MAAIVAAARLLVRLGRAQEALNWLEFAGDDPQIRAEVEEILDESINDPLLLTRIAAGGHALALELIERNFNDLHLLRHSRALEVVTRRVMKGAPNLQLAALHTAFELLATDLTSYSARHATRQLAMKVLRRKRTWDQADFVALLRWLIRLSHPDVLPWSTLLTQIAKSVTADSISASLLQTLTAVERHFVRQGVPLGETIRLLKRLRRMREELDKREDDPW